jgi:hypothetical protein
MTFGTSIFVIAVGAVLKFAVHVSTTGFNLHTIGLILMIVGIGGLVLSFLWLTVWSGRQREGEAPQRAVRDR